MQTPVQARMIVEVLGRPQEHVASALKLLVAKIEREPEVRLLSATQHEVIPVKDGTELFTSYAEITLETKSLDALFALLFTYLPANVEIITPTQLTVKNEFLNGFANTLVQRLHTYEAVTKRLLTDRDKAIHALHMKRPDLLKKVVQEQGSAKKRKKIHQRKKKIKE
jgi:hypothetical protein